MKETLSPQSVRFRGFLLANLARIGQEMSHTKEDLLFEIERQEAQILQFERQIARLKKKEDQLLNPPKAVSIQILPKTTESKIESEVKFPFWPLPLTSQSSEEPNPLPVFGNLALFNQIHKQNQETAQLSSAKLALDVDHKTTYTEPSDYPFWKVPLLSWTRLTFLGQPCLLSDNETLNAKRVGCSSGDN
jgi:hypothetical protein